MTKLSTNDYQITGGNKLSGSIEVNTSKNGALHLICTTLLNRGTSVLHRIPRIAEVDRMIEVLHSIGVSVEWTADHTLTIQPPKRFKLSGLSNESSGRMRSTLMLIGSLMHRADEFRMPHSGGCKMGDRTIAAHRRGLEPFGVKIKTEEEFYHITCKKPRAAEVTLYEASDTGTTNILRAAAGVPKTSTIHFPTQNYMVQDTIGYLRALGVVIEQDGPAALKVTGLADINQDIEYYNSEDPIEAMAFLTAGIITNSTLTVTRCPIDFLRLEMLKLKTMGLKYDQSKVYLSDNGFTKLVDITVKPSKLKALVDKIHPLPYPGINVDPLPFFVPIAALASGRTLIHDWMWENRAIYYTELNRLGARITLMDPHRALIDGVETLRAGDVVCPPALRPSMIILLTMLAAPGTSKLYDVYSISRGYEKLPERLAKIGAVIKEI